VDVLVVRLEIFTPHPRGEEMRLSWSVVIVPGPGSVSGVSVNYRCNYIFIPGTFFEKEITKKNIFISNEFLLVTSAARMNEYNISNHQLLGFHHANIRYCKYRRTLLR